MNVVHHTETRLELATNQIPGRIGDTLWGLWGVMLGGWLCVAVMDASQTGKMNAVFCLSLGVCAFGGFGCCMLWKGLMRDFRAACSFDHRTSQMVLRRYSVCQWQAIKQPLHFIHQVEVGEYTRNFVTKGYKTYAMHLVLRSGERQLIAFADLISRRSYDEAAETIRRFLKSPLQS